MAPYDKVPVPYDKVPVPYDKVPVPYQVELPRYCQEFHKKASKVLNILNIFKRTRKNLREMFQRMPQRLQITSLERIIAFRWLRSLTPTAKMSTHKMMSKTLIQM